MWARGLKAEVELSFHFHHRDCLGVLISAEVLRKRGCGQIDLARYMGGKFELWEVKSRIRGHGALTVYQWKRLRRSQQLLGNLFNKPVGLQLIEEGIKP